MLKALQIKDYWVIVDDEENKKIIAQSKPVHEGIPLFDVPKELEESVEMLAKQYFNSIKAKFGSEALENLALLDWSRGYKAAKEKYKYTEEDLKFMFEVGYRKNNLVESTFELALEYIQSLNKPKEYECQIEMEEFEVDMGLGESCIEYGKKPKMIDGKVIIKSYKKIN